MPVRKRHHHVAQYGSGGGGKGSFSPASITGLHAWYKAESIGLTDDSKVATWVDNSANGYNLTAALTARPTYKLNILNGFPVVRFDDSTEAERLRSGAITTVTDDYTIFSVMKPVAGGYAFDPDATGGSKQTLIGGFEANMIEAFNSPRVNVGSYDGTSFAIYEVVDDNTNRIGIKNGTQTESAAAEAGNDPTGPITIGGDGTGDAASFWGGDVAEFLWYSVGVSAGNRSLIRSYLGAKYGITVA